MLEVEDVHEWLFHDERSFLGSTVKKAVEEMQSANTNGNKKIVWLFIDCIPGLCDEYGAFYEMAEARVACACAAYKMGNLKRASELFHEAAYHYRPSDYHRGVVLCLVGVVFSEMRGREEDALDAWRQSKRFLKDFINYNWLHRKRIDSCETKREKINEAIKEVIQRLNGD